MMAAGANGKVQLWKGQNNTQFDAELDVFELQEG